MEIILSRTKVMVAICLLALLAGGVAAKHFWFPSVDDRYFVPDYQRLQRAPAGLFILRPTHFSKTTNQGCVLAWTKFESGEVVPRFSGRNVSLGQMLAAACFCPPSRLVLPPDLPVRRYDLLVTVPEKPAEKLQAKLEGKFGYAGSWQQQETDVWQLKAIPGKSPPSAAAATHESFKDGRLSLSHVPVSRLLGYLETALGRPVQDRTGLDGNYDFSIPASWGSRREDGQAVNGVLEQFGLTIDPGTGVEQMLVVSRAQ